MTASAITTLPPRSVKVGPEKCGQATDTKLHRDVALKILPEAFAQDPDLWVANYYSARNPLRLSSLVILGVVARMFRCATRSSCWCT